MQVKRVGAAGWMAGWLDGWMGTGETREVPPPPQPWRRGAHAQVCTAADLTLTPRPPPVCLRMLNVEHRTITRLASSRSWATADRAAIEEALRCEPEPGGRRAFPALSQARWEQACDGVRQTLDALGCARITPPS